MKRNRQTNTQNGRSTTTRRSTSVQNSIDDLVRGHGFDLPAAIVLEVSHQNLHALLSLTALLAEIKRRVVTGVVSVQLKNESIVQAFVHIMAQSFISVDELMSVLRPRVIALYSSRLEQPLPRWALANVAQSRSRGV
jgi:hypothetical protein